MKASKIETEINLILSQYKKESRFMSKRIIAKNERRYEFLMQCKRYIETNPKKEFVESEISRLENDIVILDSRYNTWRATNAVKVKNPVKFYQKLFGYAKIREQIKTLKFILENIEDEN